MLFGFILITQNCRSSEKEPESEGEHKRANFAHTIEKKMALCDLIPEEELQYDPSLLEKLSFERAQSQMIAIIRFISLSTKPEFFETYRNRYKEEGIAEEQIGTVEALKNYLKEEASKGVFEDPTLAVYLKNLRMKNDNLIEFSQKLLEQRRLLLSYIQSENKANEQLSEQAAAQQETIQGLSKENGLKSENIKKFLEEISTFEKKNDELSRENKSQRETIDEFSRQHREQQEKIDELSRENKSQSQIIAAFSQQPSEQQEKIDRLFSRNMPLQSEIIPTIPEQVRVHDEIDQPLQKPDHFQKYMIPLATFTLGASVATLCYLGYYRFTKTI